MGYRTAIFYLREYLFPFGCGGCGDALLNQRDAYYGLCGNCRGVLSSALGEEKRCVLCGKPLITEKDTCLGCRERQEADSGEHGAITGGNYSDYFVRFRKIFPYSGRYRTILASFKFKKSTGVGNFLTGCLQGALKDLGAGVSMNDSEAAWVPVPPRPGKVKKQGWDQIEFLARALEGERQRSRGNNDFLPVRRCLKRLPSRTQKELSREERKMNLKGRITCVKPPPRTAILFDDVITTGATLDACAAVLKEGGAEKVYGICLFYD